MKILTCLLTAFLTGVIATNAQERLVLSEIFTSENCPPSRPADSTAWALMNSGTNPSNVQFITFDALFHPATLYDTDPTDYDARTNYYGVPFVSYSRIDGKATASAHPGYPIEITQPILDVAIMNSTAFQIVATYSQPPFGAADIDVHIKSVSAFMPPAAAMKLYIACVRTLDYVNPPGSNRQTHFENMVRKMYPSPSGTAISNSWAAGDTASFHLSGYIPSESGDSARHPHLSGPVTLVVWIQNDRDSVVAQAARALCLNSLQIGTEVNPCPDSLTINLYPNPAKDFIILSNAAGRREEVTIEIADILGNSVYKSTWPGVPGNQPITISVAQFCSGLYLARIMNGGKTDKIVFSVVK
jgi:hypothetical protein